MEFAWNNTVLNSVKPGENSMQLLGFYLLKLRVLRGKSLLNPS